MTDIKENIFEDKEGDENQTADNESTPKEYMRIKPLTELTEKITQEHKEPEPKEYEDIELLNKIEEFSKPILESVPKEYIKSFTHCNIKYFTDYYNVSNNNTTNNHDSIIRKHTNDTLLVSIAKGHDIFRGRKKIISIDFGGRNSACNKSYSKSKRGTLAVGKNSVLCRIKCEGEDIAYPIYTGVRTNLLEINNNVLQDPNLLTTSYKDLGYLAVMSVPPNTNFNDLLLLNEENYEDYLKTRNTM